MTAKKKARSKPKPTRKARPKPKHAPTQSVALVVRDPTGMVPQQTALSVSRQIGQGIALLGELGLVELKFTPAEEEAMNEPINEARVRMKPGKKGPPIPFLPHIEYTRWYNRAFGRGGWNMVPIDHPKLTNKTVSRDYVLFVHGKPVAFATGEQDYFETNERQTYGDALEATMSSALRRCAKHLGMGLELWDKDWIDRFIRKSGYRREQPEQGEPDSSRQRARSEPSRPKPTARTGQDDERITTEQRQRLFLIGKRAGRTKPEIIAYVKDVLGLPDSSRITRRNYQAVVDAIEKPGPLPGPPREPDAILDADINWGLKS